MASKRKLKRQAGPSEAELVLLRELALRLPEGVQFMIDGRARDRAGIHADLACLIDAAKSNPDDQAELGKLAAVAPNPLADEEE